MLAGLLAGLASAALFGVAAVVQAHGARRTTGATAELGIITFWRRAVTDPVTLGVVVAYLGGFVLHAVAIWLLPLYVAQATISLSFPITAIAARRIERSARTGDLVAVVVATLALGLVAAGAGDPGDPMASWWIVGSGLIGVLLVAGLGATTSNGVLLGSLAGIGYALSAIAVRGVAWPVSGAEVVLAALSVPLLGAAAFWVYSRALAAASVPTATAPVIVGQTAIPALVGVWLLGDGVRPGWGAGVTVGLVAAVGAVGYLSRTSTGTATGSSPGPARPAGR